jgi:hypothetical protein
VATVNNIRCCGLTKAYKALSDSRKGCLSDCNLYSTALLQYQVSSLADYTTESCLTQAQYNSLLQGLTLVCGCCSENDVFNNPDTTEQEFCFFQAVVTDDNSFIGWEIDNEELIPNINSVMDTYGGRGETYSEDLDPAGAIITYFGLETDLPNPDIEDSNVDVPYTWSDPICEQTCWQYEFPKPDFIMTNINLGFSPTINFLGTLAIGQVINVQLGINLTLLETFLKGIYGPQVTVSAVTLPSTNILVTISGVYIPSTATVTGNTTVGGPFTWNNISCP